MNLTSTSTRWFGALLGVSVAAYAPAAVAAGDADRAAAQALFDAGKKLLEAQRYAEACPKLEESNRLDPAVGTKFNLADCDEHIGKTASAWTLFLEVAAATHAAGQLDREKAARDRAASLERGLSRLTIVARKDAVALEVKRDGGVVGPALWGTPVPIDPGEHVISASAPGKTTWETKVTVEAGGRTAAVSVPDLQDGPAGAGTSADASGGGWSTQRWIGVGVAGAGVVALGVGSALGLAAKSKNDEAHKTSNCPSATTCFPNGAKLVSGAKGLATASTIAFIGGAAFVAGGVVLFVTAPGRRPAETGLVLHPYAGPGEAGASLGGSF